MQEKIGQVILDDTYYPGQDYYSDGVIEDELLEIVSNHTAEEYNRIIADRKDWAVLYHLSDVRANIVSWYPIHKDETVLEIGSGCGAITGTLADKAKKVTCIELSKRRSMINATRNRERDNIEILLGNFETVEENLTEQYDYITLIGVLEYGQSYISSEHPYEDFLKKIRRHLKPNGRLIIAIENKLGMKYFAGCREDHTAQFFSGIEDYQGNKGVRTFSRKELEELLLKTGYEQSEFYYPYPDYKLPLRMYSDRRLPLVGELDLNNTKNFDNSRAVLFDETKAFDSVIKAGVFPVFSNSYLVVAGAEVSGAPDYADMEKNQNHKDITLDEMYHSFGQDRIDVMSALDAPESELTQLKTQVREQQQVIEQMEHSKAWRLYLFYRRLFKRQ